MCWGQVWLCICTASNDHRFSYHQILVLPNYHKALDILPVLSTCHFYLSLPSLKAKLATITYTWVIVNNTHCVGPTVVCCGFLVLFLVYIYRRWHWTVATTGPGGQWIRKSTGPPKTHWPPQKHVMTQMFSRREFMISRVKLHTFVH